MRLVPSVILAVNNLRAKKDGGRDADLPSDGEYDPNARKRYNPSAIAYAMPRSVGSVPKTIQV